MYKINLHAHTIFSDGENTPYRMALEAKRLGFTALVITDHYYGSKSDGGWNISDKKFRVLRRAAKEAKEILPVIIGIELASPCLQEEVLCFGSAFVNQIIEHREAEKDLTIPLLQKWKQKYYGACILCHPGEPENWEALLPLLDGFEHFNSGQNQFIDGDFGVLYNLPRWSNSDAHQFKTLDLGYNEVSSKITTETDLIKYIRSGRQPVLHVRGENE